MSTTAAADEAIYDDDPTCDDCLGTGGDRDYLDVWHPCWACNGTGAMA